MKDKNKPKGAMSAYACFVQVIREEHKKKHPGEQVVFSDFSKKCAERWKAMVPKERKRFDDMAALDKDRHNREMNDYIPPDGVRKGKKRKQPRDPSVPRRAWSAFFFFCDEFRSKVKEVNQDWKVSDVAKELGKMWEVCTNKPKFDHLAQQDKQRYEEDMAKYRAGCYIPVERKAPHLDPSLTSPMTAEIVPEVSQVEDVETGSAGDENNGTIKEDDEEVEPEDGENDE